MNQGRAIELTGVVMLVAAVVALMFNIQLLALDGGDPTVASLLALIVGVAGIIVGEVRRET
jgi:hypothetical protein